MFEGGGLDVSLYRKRGSSTAEFARRKATTRLANSQYGSLLCGENGHNKCRAKVWAA